MVCRLLDSSIRRTDLERSCIAQKRRCMRSRVYAERAYHLPSRHRLFASFKFQFEPLQFRKKMTGIGPGLVKPLAVVVDLETAQMLVHHAGTLVDFLEHVANASDSPQAFLRSPWSGKNKLHGDTVWK
jgi:hypothetical protein